jgi:hypothetical protein
MYVWTTLRPWLSTPASCGGSCHYMHPAAASIKHTWIWRQYWTSMGYCHETHSTPKQPPQRMSPENPLRLKKLPLLRQPLIPAYASGRDGGEPNTRRPNPTCSQATGVLSRPVPTITQHVSAVAKCSFSWLAPQRCTRFAVEISLFVGRVCACFCGVADLGNMSRCSFRT